MVQDDGPVGLDRVRVAFDDQRAVADAGIALPVTLAARLGIEALVDRCVRLGARAGAAVVEAGGDDGHADLVALGLLADDPARLRATPAGRLVLDRLTTELAT